jgi:hypothetical protein
MVTKMLPTQKILNRWYPGSQQSKCRLCGAEPDDVVHAIITCPNLSKEISPAIMKLWQAIQFGQARRVRGVMTGQGPAWWPRAKNHISDCPTRTEIEQWQQSMKKLPHRLLMIPATVIA